MFYCNLCHYHTVNKDSWNQHLKDHESGLIAERQAPGIVNIQQLEPGQDTIQNLMAQQGVIMMPVGAQNEQSDKPLQPQTVTLQLPGSNTTTQVLLLHPAAEDSTASAAATEAANSLIMYSLQAEEHGPTHNASVAHQLIMQEAEPAEGTVAPPVSIMQSHDSSAADAPPSVSEPAKHEVEQSV